MDLRFKRLALLVMPSVVALAMAGCGSDSNESGGFTSDSNFSYAAPALPSDTVAAEADVAPADANTIRLYLVDPDLSSNSAAAKSGRDATGTPWANYSLWLYNQDTCQALATDADDGQLLSTDGDTENGEAAAWGSAQNTPTGYDEYGPYWDLKLKDGAMDDATACVNLIVRDAGQNKILGDNNDGSYALKLANFSDRTVTAREGDRQFYDAKQDAYADWKANTSFDMFSAASAHLIDANTLVWSDSSLADAKFVRLYYSANNGTIVAGEDGKVTDKFIKLTATELTDEQKAAYPHLSGFTAFSLPSNVDADTLKAVLKNQVAAVALDSKGTLLAGTYVQTAGGLDDLYAESAKELSYGAMVADDGVTFRLWAPTATAVSLVIYNEDKSVASTEAMTLDNASGAWSYTGDTSLVGKYYRYAITVYHPVDRKWHSYEVTDPYSLSLSMNSTYSQVVDLESADLKPAGWDDLKAPHTQLDNPAKIVTLETHIRDFSARDVSTPEAERGKYLAFTDTETVPVQHMMDLAKSGVTHMHLMPTFDIATINEDPAKRVDLPDPVSKLCELNSAMTSSEFSGYCDSAKTVQQVFEELEESDSKSNPVVQRFESYLRDYDSFNWGYDPFHYTVPEGSYASEAEGTTRIKEFREMVMAIKQNIGMNVVMDVVYNHTNAAGPSDDKSVLDKIVPWYYHRLDELSGDVEMSTCCSNTAPEHAMFAKLMSDSLVTWAKEYKIDSFRFDLNGFHPKAQMLDALAKVKTVNPDMFFYSEGWDYGETVNNTRFVTASQLNMGGTGISTYSDRLRDAVRGGGCCDDGTAVHTAQGFGNGAYVEPNTAISDDAAAKAAAMAQTDLVRLGMAGNLKDFVLTTYEGVPTKGSDMAYGSAPAGYAVDPFEVLNYVTKHDNQSIWDITQYKAADETTLDERVRMTALSQATVLLGQGIVFSDIGGEFLRSKSFNRDSYNSGDWFNWVDYTLEDNNYDKGYPRADKDSAKYDLIEHALAQFEKPTNSEMTQMLSYFKEMLKIRSSSELFTLGTGAKVMERVDFRNTGPEQVPGLIVMTLDDGTGVADLDAKLDAAVVIVNSSPSEQTVGDFIDGSGNAIALAGYQLHDVQTELGAASIGSGATFAEGEFTVPAWSVAVFVKPQGDAQGTGLPVSKKQDLSTVEPFSVPVYARGFGGTWDALETNQFAFTGADYSYTWTVEVTDDMLSENGTSMKVADADWSAINYGKCNSDDKLVPGTPLTLCAGGSTGDVPMDLTKAGTYTFTFKVVNKASPTLTLAIEEPAAACELLSDTNETPTLGDTQLALRGAHSSWNWDVQYKLGYKGNGIYEAVITEGTLTGGFKVSADSSAWDPQFFASQGGSLVTNMEPDVVYEAYGRFGGAGSDQGNNNIALSEGNWLFRLKLDTTAEMSGAGVKGTIDVCQLP
ncbi:pullulanase-type alpha-1,6-glucosidase [Pseudaeromonas paramecii]|uniref:Pullulanase-type alpha-1,6-glucosidase n=1 Tax=Pseudaeromonas paramecii TaxID=2138166 RepID=A0ABP8Q9U7_9GAMM